MDNSLILSSSKRQHMKTDIRKILLERIMVIDGAMGTMIQEYQLTEQDYRGKRFADYHRDIKGNNDLLSITQPQVITAIHQAFLDAGADIIETNTFNANSISLADYEMEELAYEINYEAAKLPAKPSNPTKVKILISPGL